MIIALIVDDAVARPFILCSGNKKAKAELALVFMQTELGKGEVSNEDIARYIELIGRQDILGNVLGERCVAPRDRPPRARY